MNTMNYQWSFPDIGKRSPILKVYTKNLCRSYYLTNALIFLTIALIFGYAKWQQWLYAERIRINPQKPPHVMVIVPGQLSQPPSLMGEEPMSTASTAKSGVPTIGVPMPVPDLLATQETSPTQADITGTRGLTTSLVDSGAVIQVVPNIGVYVPHQVEPKVVHKPPLNYPEMARLLDQEGTVFVQALVDLDGSVMKVVIVRSSKFPMLDTAAVMNVSEWKFTPALQHQTPVRVWAGSNVSFKLK